MSRFTTTVLAAAALSLGLATVSSAADLRPAYKAPAPVAAPVQYSWSGFYIGGHAGAGWFGDSDSNAFFVGGGQIGYNWALSPNWVIGIEADISATDQSTSGAVAVFDPILGPGTITASADLNWIASVRGRLGYTWDRFMVYFTGGGAWADLEGSATAAFPAVGTATVTASADASGWVIGGGAEWMFAPNWTLGVEYLHYEFDDISGTVTGPGGSVAFNFSGDVGSIDVVRARLNYKFGDWFGKGKGAPVAARY
jgi:outer membrane immunogenic protein